MDLPDLPPDIAFRRLVHGAADRDHAYEVKRRALGPHVAARWGWDDVIQREIHARRYADKPFFGIEARAARPGAAPRRLGTLSFEVLPDHVRFGEFYIWPERQGQGLGASVLTHCLSVAAGLGLPVRLEHLRWNPVGALYRRHGFVETGRSATHCFLERPAPPAARP